MDEEGLVARIIEERCNPFRKEDHSDFSSPALLHLQSLNLPGSQLARACVTYFQEPTTPLGKPNVHNFIFWPCLSFQLQPCHYPLPSILCTAPPKTSFQFPPYSYSLCVCISFHPNSEGPEKRTHFAFSQVPGYPQQCFGSQFKLSPLESLFWSPNVNQIPLTYELLESIIKFPLQHL